MFPDLGVTDPTLAIAAAICGSLPERARHPDLLPCRPKPIPHFQLSQCAQDFTPHSAQPLRRSSSAINVKNRPLAALR